MFRCGGGPLYDDAGNLTATSGAVYDTGSRRLSHTDGHGTTSYGYDPANRLTSVNGPQGAFEVGYDPAGRRQSLTAAGHNRPSTTTPAG